MTYSQYEESRWSGVVLLLCFAVVSVACDVNRGSSDFPAQTVPDVVDETDAGSTAGDAALGGGQGAGTMAGTWVLVHERSTCVEVFEVQEQLTRAVYRVEIEQDGPKLQERRRLCEISLSDVFGQSIAIPDDVLSSIRFLDIDHGLVSSIAPGGSYTSASEVAFWGLDPAKFSDPLSDPLPSKPGKGTPEIDADGDKHPGVTYELQDGRCLRYTGQRQIIRYRGSFESPNEVRGSSTGFTDLIVFGSSKSICQFSPTIEPNDPHSRFRMYRIDGQGGALQADRDDDGTIDCAEIKSLPIDTVFAPRGPDDSKCKRE